MSSTSHDRLTLRLRMYTGCDQAKSCENVGKSPFCFTVNFKKSKSFSAQIVSHGFQFLHGMWICFAQQKKKKVLFWLSCFHCLTTHFEINDTQVVDFGFQFRIVMCVYNRHNIPHSYLIHLMYLYILFTLSSQLPQKQQQR